MPPTSVSSTTCSNPQNDTLEKVIENDKVRYVRKGYGLITASVIVLTYFLIIPRVAKTIWPEIIKNYEPNQIYFVCGFLFHTGMFTFSNLIMYFIYSRKIPFFERYKIHPEKPWPWEEDPQKWKEVFRKSLRNFFFSNLVVVPTLLYLDTKKGIPFRFDVETFPDSWEVIRQVLFFMLIEDFMFYWIHRTLHLKWLYPYIHKIHHEYKHPISISAEYAHPFEFLIANAIPTVAGPTLLGNKVHYATVLMWVTIRIFETIDGHSGYEFSWSPYRLLPLSGSANYHNYHHTHNAGNYGSFFTFWDTLMGTNKNYYQFLSKKQQAEALNTLRKQFEEKKDKTDETLKTLIESSPDKIEKKIQ